MQIIPAIDIIDGKCVRLTQGDYAQKKIYNEQPLEVARQFEDQGIKRLHLVDLDGAKAGTVINLGVLENIAAHTALLIDFGGGIKSDEDIVSIFEAGAAIATVGSIAVKKPEIFYQWLKDYGSEKILLGADVKGEKIAINGWQDETDLSVMDFLAEPISRGLKQAFCTDISRDGLLEGPSVLLYREIMTRYPGLYFIASGGVSSLADLIRLDEIGCQGAIVGKAIYENRIKLSELKRWMD